MNFKLLLLTFFSVFPSFIYSQGVSLSDNEVLQYGFSLPLDNSFRQENKDIKNLAGLHKQIDDFFIPSNLYFNAYETLTVHSGKKKEESKFVVEYTIGGKEYKSHSLFKPVLKKQKNYKTATLIIPGSNENQSTEIFKGIGYHKNIASEVAQLSDVYIAVKPNQDYLALHKDGGRINYYFLINYMLNKGGSYSVSYLVNTLATVKYLKTKYDRVFVIGLSQGGLAALYNALQSSPDAAIVASGYTVTRDLYEWAGQDQLIIPNSLNYLSKEKIRERIGQQHTNYFFSWGTNEVATYKLEAEYKYTTKYFKGLNNVESVFHDQGHSFPQPFSSGFLSRIPYARIDFALTGKDCGQEIYLKPVKLSSHKMEAYQWYRNDTLLDYSGDSLLLRKGGSYKLVVTTKKDKRFVSNQITEQAVHFNRSLTLTKRLIVAPEGFNSYKWYRNGELLAEETHQTLTIRQPGRYQCCLSNYLGNFSSDEVVIQDNYAFQVKDLEVNVYPNPNNGHFKLELVSPVMLPEKIILVLFNDLGQKVYERVLTPGQKIEEFDLNIQGVKRGLYHLKAITPTNTIVKTIVVS